LFTLAATFSQLAPTYPLSFGNRLSKKQCTFGKVITRQQAARRQEDNNNKLW
jgi:hypothetical protein